MNRKEENLLREFVRDNIVKPMIEQRRQEQKVRQWVRSLISEAKNEQYLSTLFEAKDMTNPHPNTGINKLRDTLRKAKPSIKTKYQQLTTDPAQRESFKNHFLNALVRMFDELDALSAQGKEAEDIKSEFDPSKVTNDLEAPPADQSSDDIADDIESGLSDLENLEESLLESIINEIEVEIEGDEEVDIISDEEEQKKEKSQAEKDFSKKSDQEEKRQNFAGDLDGDMTGRNQAFDAFNLVQSYFADAYLDLNNPEDIEMFKKWGLYNSKLLLDKYEEELAVDPPAPDIENPS
jgi:hypothetical protein